MKKVYIVSAVRTPMGSFGGALSSVPATSLGAAAIKGALQKAEINPKDVNEVLMGNVLQANCGQAPARQAAIEAGIPDNVPATTINKVCSSGMKAIMMGAQSILLGDNEIVVSGGMENMSRVPFYSQDIRWGSKLGDRKLIDGLVKDGLTDVYNGYHMGNAAELCASKYKISREEQDEFAIESYLRSKSAWESGKFNNEVIPVKVQQRKGGEIIVEKDEEYCNVNLDKIPKLKAVFQKEGTITAANASTLNDGAAAILLMSENKVNQLEVKPIAEILAYADAAQKPEEFTTAPSKAVSIALEKAELNINDVAYFELNEAFSVVGLVNCKILDIDLKKVNVNGGAVSLGHPLGCSGARITTTLLNVLKQNNGKIGVAGICNGGGGASAIVVKSL
ncbi:MAG: acetyl-CoA C-acyltransferase [Flavobacteriales bacterium]|nr:acetyl-CoA C-acyltransferase [Flavobacteriales bacterium]|tara:strand:+ start:29680 stop:30858 length:1179 start_codon:yes stop_codon:yes gene_type:complete